MYKADLMAKLNAKEGRHNLIKEKRNQVSNNGYKQSVVLRDQFAATAYSTQGNMQPMPYEAHRKEFLSSKAAKAKPVEQN